MQNAKPFELVLSYPQWQGSGRFENLRRGAQAAAEVCSQFGPVMAIPDAGEGEAKDGVNRWTAILDQFRSTQKLLAEIRPRTILTAGGDCACDIAVIDYLHRVYPDLTVIWVDAHLDANTPATSPSGNLHGMPVSSIMGSAPEGLRPLLSAPLPLPNFAMLPPTWATRVIGSSSENMTCHGSSRTRYSRARSIFTLTSILSVPRSSRILPIPKETCRSTPA